MQVFWDISPASQNQAGAAASPPEKGDGLARGPLHATFILTPASDQLDAQGLSHATRESIMTWAAEENGAGHYIGRCRVIDVRDAVHIIRPEHLAGHLFGKVTRVLIRTRQDVKSHVVLSVEALKLLASCGVKLIGIDTPSLDAPNSGLRESYKAAVHHGISLLFNLSLAEVTPGDYEMIALPLDQEKKAGSLKDLEKKHAKSSTTRAA